MSKIFLYVSGWKEHGGAPGISLFSFDTANGGLEPLGRQFEELSCGCTAYDAARRVLYITNELHENPDYIKGGGGLVWAFRVGTDGALTRLSRAECACPCPAYLSLDGSGRYLLCANHSGFSAVTKAVRGEDGYYHTKVEYDDAFVGVFALRDDGSIGPLVDVHRHDAYPVPGRALHARPHTVQPNPDKSLFACCDKGDGHIYMYRLSAAGRLTLASEPYDDGEGAAPRYCAFHPTKPYFYANHERDMRLCAFRCGENGALTKINTAMALGGEVPQNTAREARAFLHGGDIDLPADGFMPLEQQGLAMHPGGRFLYSVLNGADAVSVFEIDGQGAAALRETVPVEGRWARACAISPDGRFLATACLQSGDLYVFGIKADGGLEGPVSSGKAPGGSYLTFIE